METDGSFLERGAQFLASPKGREIVDQLVARLVTPGCTASLDQLIAKKPAALVKVQRDSFLALVDRLLELGWSPDRLIVNPEAGCIAGRSEEGTQMIFLQAVQDTLFRSKLNAYRSHLPEHLRIHTLPMDNVGALAAMDLNGLTGFDSTTGEEYIAMSGGLVKLHYWARTILHTMGMSPGNGQESAVTDATWWRSSLSSVAFDVLGCTTDPVRIANIAFQDGRNGSLDALSSATTLMEAFMVYHEIGHFELDHGLLLGHAAQASVVSTELYHQMEAEADGFALDVLGRFASAPALASTVSLLFLLFALSPELVRKYPFCDDTAVYPHPLTRLIWLLRRLFPTDAAKQARYLNTMVNLLLDAVADTGKDVSGMADAIRYVVMNKVASPARYQVDLE